MQAIRTPSAAQEELRAHLDQTALSRLALVSVGGCVVVVFSTLFDWLLHPKLAPALTVGNATLFATYAAVAALNRRGRIAQGSASAVGAIMWIMLVGQLAWSFATVQDSAYTLIFVLYAVACGPLHLYRSWTLVTLASGLGVWTATGFHVSGGRFAVDALVSALACVLALMLHEIAVHYLRRLTELNLRDARNAADLSRALETASREIDERRRVESALREREQELSALSDATAEALFVHSDGVILATNRAARELFLLPEDGAVGRRLLDFAAPEAAAQVAERLTRMGPGPFESVARRTDGVTFPVAARGRELSFRGRSARLVAVRDLTELRQMQSSLAFADRMASVGTLAAGVAHEINNPLTFIMLNLEDALRSIEARDASSPTNAEATLEMLRDALVGAGRVRDIVRDLKTFARADDESVGSVELGTVIAYATRMAGAELRHRARLSVHLPELPEVRGNETRLGQVFLNLLVNSAQAMPQGAAHENSVTIGAEVVGSVVVVSVADTGSGIAPELVGRVFDPFVTTKAHGTGLGLAICHGIVTSLGGSITVESEVGKGTTFRVSLPVAPAPACELAPASAPPRAATRAATRVLVIDDEDALLRSASRILGPPYETVTMTSAQLALDALARGENFQVIFCDLLMPEMTGMAFYEALAARFPHAAGRTVFLTGGVFTRQAEEFLATTPRPCVEKPFTAAALHDAVRLVLDSVAGDAPRETADHPEGSSTPGGSRHA